jgi:RNA polymerase sigma factor (sigma-70 family)
MKKNPASRTPDSRKPTDTELITRCLQGEANAWKQLVDRYARLVHSVPVRAGLTPMEVDDVGQEVFLALAQNMHRLEDPERVSAWLITTARRLSWRALQKRNREEVSDRGELMELHLTASDIGDPTARPAHLPGMEELIEGWNRQSVLQQAFADLDPRCQELLQLLFLDPSEPSYDDICERLGMAKGSIGPTRNRCLQKLRAILEGLGYDDSRK